MGTPYTFYIYMIICGWLGFESKRLKSVVSVAEPHPLVIQSPGLKRMLKLTELTDEDPVFLLTDGLLGDVGSSKTN